MINPFLTGTMAELFCTETRIVPEMTHQGAIIVLEHLEEPVATLARA